MSLSIKDGDRPQLEYLKMRYNYLLYEKTKLEERIRWRKAEFKPLDGMAKLHHEITTELLQVDQQRHDFLFNK